jgi:hypothetical protein
VSVASVVKWSQRFRATGSAAAYWMGGHRRRVLAGERDWLLGRLAEKPDLTLRALVAELVERGIPNRGHDMSSSSCSIKQTPELQRPDGGFYLLTAGTHVVVVLS